MRSCVIEEDSSMSKLLISQTMKPSHLLQSHSQDPLYCIGLSLILISPVLSFGTLTQTCTFVRRIKTLEKAL